MNIIKKHKLVLLFVAGIVLSLSLATQIGVQRVYAAAGTWIDSSTIDINGQKFVDPVVGDRMNYNLTTETNCVDEIRGFNKDYKDKPDFSKATLVVRTINAETNQCEGETEEPLTLSSTQNALGAASWIDSGAIQISVGYEVPCVTKNISGTNKRACDFSSNRDIKGKTFNAVPGMANTYTLQTGACNSSIRVTSNGSATTAGSANLILRGGLSNCNSDQGWEIPIQLAQAQNATKPPGTGTPTTPGDAASPEDTTTDEGCESNGGALGWILCPVANIMDGVVGWLDSTIQDQLIVKEDRYDNPELLAAWRNVRNIAYIILIPIMLVMVIGTALGFEVFSAYTVKRALPRMIIAVIFITLSWYICIFLIDFVNVIGTGVLGIITSPFETVSAGLKGALATAQIVNNTGDGDGAGLGLAAIVATTGFVGFATGFVSISIILSTLFSAALVLGAIFLLLVARQMFIILLILAAPLAILAWIFPGNDKGWKIWWGSFSKLLLMFPLIMALLGVGRIFASVVAASAAGDPNDVQIVTTIIIVAAYIIPFLAVPFAFKWVGGVFGTVAGMVNDRNSGLLDRGKKFRGEKRAEKMADAKNYSRYSDRNAFTRGMNSLGGGLRNGPKTWTPSRTRAARSALGAASAAGTLKEDSVYQANQNDDKFLLALGDKELAQKKMAGTSGTERAAWETALASASQVKSRNSNDTKLASLNALAATGYQFSAGQKGYNELAESMAKVTGAQLTRDTEGNVVGATGSGAGAYANAMNSAQYNLKNAGRFDLAGINNGAGYDSSTGLSKASLYQLANGKKESIKTMVQDIPAGPLVGSAGERAAVAYKELDAMRPNATGAVAKEIEDQMEALRSRGVETYMRTGVLDSSGAPVMIDATERFDSDRGNPTHARYDAAYVASWSPTDLARGGRTVTRQQTLGDVAESRARTYSRPDPNNIT